MLQQILSRDVTITINEKQMAQLHAKAETRLGLSEPKRKQIFKEIVSIQERAAGEASRKYPVTANQPLAVRSRQIDKQNALQEQLLERYFQELARKHRITKKQLEEIISEGIEKDWPLPKFEGSL